jgi:L-alanine-DL-glutamate epimerase-like enolase superfamily enzyme
VTLVRLKVDASVTPEKFSFLEDLDRPVLLDYNGSRPTFEIVQEQVALTSVHVPIAFIEQIGRVGDFTAHIGFADLGVPLSIDESLRSIQDLRNVERYHAASVVCIKPTRVGGRAVARTMVEEALQMGLTPYIGGFFETALGRYANCEIAAEFNLGPSDTLLDSFPVTRAHFDAVRQDVLSGKWEAVAVF